jgi:hypothetical protein
LRIESDMLRACGWGVFVGEVRVEWRMEWDFTGRYVCPLSSPNSAVSLVRHGNDLKLRVVTCDLKSCGRWLCSPRFALVRCKCSPSNCILNQERRCPPQQRTSSRLLVSLQTSETNLTEFPFIHSDKRFFSFRAGGCTFLAQLEKDQHAKGAMWISDEILERLIKQANNELASSNYYLSFSLWFADQELPGSAASMAMERVRTTFADSSRSRSYIGLVPPPCPRGTQPCTKDLRPLDQAQS